MMTSAVRWTLVLIGTAAYFAVAVIGRGGLAAFFSSLPLTALAIVLFALSGVALFAGGNVSPGVREDRDNRWVLAAFGVLGLLDAYLPAYTDRIDFWTIDGDTMRCGSGRSLCSATASAGWSRSSPGTRWSPTASMA
jgi:hypothetical protein